MVSWGQLAIHLAPHLIPLIGLICLTTDGLAPYVATWWHHHRASTVCAASLALLVVIGANLISAFGILHTHNPLACASIDK